MTTQAMPPTQIRSVSCIITEIGRLTDEGKIIWSFSRPYGENRQVETTLPLDVHLRIRMISRNPQMVVLSANKGLTPYFQIENHELPPEIDQLLMTLYGKILSRVSNRDCLFSMSLETDPEFCPSVAAALLLIK